jgi:hypothetical protein
MNVGSGRAAIRRMAGRWRLRIWVGVAVALGLGLGLLPLFGVLGYELALVMSVVAAIAGLDLGAAHARELQWIVAPAIARSVYPGRALARTTCAASLLAVGVVAIPGVIAAVRGIWVPTCDWVFGIEAYAVLPIATAVLAGAMGHAIGVAVGSRPPDAATRDRRYALAFAGLLGVALAVQLAFVGPLVTAVLAGACVAVVVGGLLWWIAPHRSTVAALAPLAVIAWFALYRFYSAPPVFSYNAILGYFPGNLYDENVQLGAALLWSRVEQLVWVVFVLALVASRLDVPTHAVAREARPVGRRVGALLLALVAACSGVALYFYSGVLGYRIDAEEIADELGGRIETEHFVIHYTRTREIEGEIELIAADHELRYAQVVAQIGAAPPGKIHSFYFASSEQKGRWIGARNVEMAKPWRREIYLDHRAFPHGSLRHEIAHAVASAFGDPMFRVAAQRIAGVPVFVSPGLIEGFAVAMDWPAGYDRLTPHEAVRAMQLMGITPSVKQLLSLQFLTVSSARSYTIAGSFMRYLLDVYGPASMRRLYSTGGDFEGSYGKGLDTLEGEWRAMISKISVPADVVEGNRERFRHGSVFARPCPHAIAAQRERAARAWASGDVRGAVSLIRDVCKDAPEEPRYQLELGDYLSSVGDAERAEAIALWTKLATSEDATSSLRADAYDRLAHEAGMRGDLVRVKQLIGAARELPVDANARRQLDAQWFALEHQGAAGPALRGYFFAPPFGFDSEQFALLATIGEPELGLGHYLLGLQKHNQRDWAASAESLLRAVELGLPNISFTRNAARRLAVAAFRAGDEPRLRRAIETLRQSGMIETDRLLATDWEQRLEMAKTGHLSKSLHTGDEQPATPVPLED